jgi:hypothetical protein
MKDAEIIICDRLKNDQSLLATKKYILESLTAQSIPTRSVQWLHSGTALHKHPDRVKRDKTEFERVDNKIMHTLYLLEILYYI